MNSDPQNSPAFRDNHRNRFNRPGEPIPWQWLGGEVNDCGDPALDPLNRTLVAGLIVEVMLKDPTLVREPGAGCQRLKACLRRTLAVQLAGRIPLASFHTLAQRVDQWFEVIYPLLTDAGLAAFSPEAGGRRSSNNPLLREDLFFQTLDQAPGVLPQRRHRKLDREKLRDFLENTGGRWFRLGDFEKHFRVDRKTAWEYVQKLLHLGLLVHNQGHSSAVRYRLAPRFLQKDQAPFPQSGQPAGPGDRPH